MKQFTTYLLSSLLALVLAAPCVGFDETSFNALSPDERLALVLAGLESRQAVLANHHWQIKETRLGHGEDGDVTFETSSYELFFDEDRFFARVTRFAPSGERKSQFVSLWDGKQERSLQLNDPEPTGRIQDVRSDYVGLIDYVHMCGLWRRGDKMSVAEWIRRAAADPKAAAKWPDGIFIIQAVPAPEDATGILIEVGVRSSIRTERYWISPEYDFAIVRHAYEYQSKDSFNRWSTDTSGWARQHGIWVPVHVVQQASTSATPGASSRPSELTGFEPQKVQWDKLQIEFSVGARIVDHIKNRAYRIGEDGSEHPVPLYDAATGQD